VHLLDNARHYVNAYIWRRATGVKAIVNAA